MPSLRITLWTVCTVNATVVFLQVVCVSQEVDHERHVGKTQNGICDFNCSLAMIFPKKKKLGLGWFCMAVISRTQLFDAIVIVVGNYFVHGAFFLSVGPVIFCTCESHSS